MSDLRCPACGTAIGKQDMDLATGTALCGACGDIVDVPELQADAAPPTVPEVPERPLPPMPEGFQVVEDASRLEITFRWWHWKFLFLAFFCVFWDGFLVVWYGLGLGMLTSGTMGGGEGVMFSFPLIHVAVGVALTWYTVAGFVNRTKVTVADGGVSIAFHPMWWPGQKTIVTSQITQLYAKRHVRRTKNGTTITYAVHVEDRRGVHVKLLGGLITPERAQWLERRIEQHLGIADRPIAGEIIR